MRTEADGLGTEPAGCWPWMAAADAERRDSVRRRAQGTTPRKEYDADVS